MLSRSSLVFACYEKSCAPPPAGKGGSSPGGRSKPVPLLNHKGERVYASEGAVRQQGRKAMSSCPDCGGNVVWLQSKKTGKWYLGSAYPSAGSRDSDSLGQSYYYVSKPHQH